MACNKPTAALLLAMLVVLVAANGALAQGGAQASNNNANKAAAGGSSTASNKGGALSAAQCREALTQAGGESALLARAPSCSSAATSTAATGATASNAGANAPLRSQLDTCCSELKAAIASDSRVQPCLCINEIWQGAKGRIAEAGLRGVNQHTIEAFAKSCGLKYAGNGC